MFVFSKVWNEIFLVTVVYFEIIFQRLPVTKHYRMLYILYYFKGSKMRKENMIWIFPYSIYVQSLSPAF